MMESLLQHCNVSERVCNGVCLPSGYAFPRLHPKAGARGLPCWKHYRLQHSIVNLTLPTGFLFKYWEAQYDESSFDELMRPIPHSAADGRTTFRSHVKTVHNLDLMTGNVHRRPYVVLVKNPFAWIRSYLFWNQRNECSDAAEIERMLSAAVLAKYATDWVTYVSKWLRLRRQAPEGRVIMITYE